MPQIRPANMDDAAALAEIHIRCWRDTYTGIVSDAYLEGMDLERNTERWRRTLESPHMQVAVIEVDGVPVGFAGWGQARENNYGYSMELYTFYILSSHRGQGLGKLALEHVRQHTGGKMMVWVLERNPYIGFYRRHGTPTAHRATIQIGGDAFEEMLFEV